MGDVDAGAEVIGSPAQPRRAFWREVAVLRRMVRDGGKAAGKRGIGNDSDAGGKDVRDRDAGGKDGTGKETDTG
jgi:hypothetical protein